MTEVHRLAPFGAGNETPVFATKNVKITGMPRRVGKHEEHLQFHIQQGRNIVKAIAFGMGERMDEMVRANSITIAYTPKFNHWAGRETIDLEIQDFLPEM